MEATFSYDSYRGHYDEILHLHIKKNLAQPGRCSQSHIATYTWRSEGRRTEIVTQWQISTKRKTNTWPEITAALQWKSCGLKSCQKVSLTHHCFGILWKQLCITLTEGLVRRAAHNQDDGGWQYQKEFELCIFETLIRLQLLSLFFTPAPGSVVFTINNISYLPEHLELRYWSHKSWRSYWFYLPACLQSNFG